MLSALILLCCLPVQGLSFKTRATDIQLFPADGSKKVNPDTQLRLAFPSPPLISAPSLIRVYDVASNHLVDLLNLHIPTSPSPYGNGSTKANYTDKIKTGGHMS
ncbi:hypothetical protein PSPO01_01886 [Paraphaeosphaeria sporulosa]